MTNIQVQKFVKRTPCDLVQTVAKLENIDQVPHYNKMSNLFITIIIIIEIFQCLFSINTIN